MDEILAGFGAAARLILTLDADLVEISLRSLQVSLIAVLIASAIALPFGAFLAVQRFRFRRTTIAVLNALMGLPPVVVGLGMAGRAGGVGVRRLYTLFVIHTLCEVVAFYPLAVAFIMAVT